MIPLFAVLVVISVSLLIVRVGAIALVMTGLSPQVARFQSRSAFFGVGFTTPEADKIMGNPVRRELVLTLMLLGNAGVITTVSSVVVSLVNVSEQGIASQLWFRMLFLVIGVALLWTLTFSKWLDQILSPVVAKALRRWTRLDVADYSELLHLADDFSVTEFDVMAGSWMVNQTLMDMRLGDEGVMILGIHRGKDHYIGAPKGSEVIRAGDRVVAYGILEKLVALETRPKGSSGQEAHVLAVEEKRFEQPPPT